MGKPAGGGQKKSPFSPLALEEHARLQTEFLTGSQLLTPKDVEPQPVHTLSRYRKKLPRRNKEMTALKGLSSAWNGTTQNASTWMQ